MLRVHKRVVVSPSFTSPPPQEKEGETEQFCGVTTSASSFPPRKKKSFEEKRRAKKWGPPRRIFFFLGRGLSFSRFGADFFLSIFSFFCAPTLHGRRAAQTSRPPDKWSRLVLGRKSYENERRIVFSSLHARRLSAGLQ